MWKRGESHGTHKCFGVEDDVMIFVIRPCQSFPSENKCCSNTCVFREITSQVMKRCSLCSCFSMYTRCHQHTFFIPPNGSVVGDPLCTVQDKNEIPQC